MNQSTGTPEPKQPRRINLTVIAPILIFAILVIVFALSLQSGDPSRIPSALIGKPAPQVDFEPLAGVTANGKPIPGVAAKNLAGGELTVVNFWASWCGPCVQEHPFLVQLAKRGVKVVGINYKDPPPGGQRFLERLGNPYRAVGVDPNGRGAIEWGVYGMPETFIVNGEGKIVFKHVGPITADVLKSQILPAIKASASPKS